jgi:hypothetical protein
VTVPMTLFATFATYQLPIISVAYFFNSIFLTALKSVSLNCCHQRGAKLLVSSTISTVQNLNLVGVA